MSRTKIPRASLSIGLLDDPEYVEMFMSPIGREAFALFTSLLMVAKSQGNEGVFNSPDNVIACLSRWNQEDFKIALDYLLNMPGKWVVKNSDNQLHIRNFKRWNTNHGGSREGSGKPPETESSCNQEDFKCNQEGNQEVQLGGASVPVPVPVPVPESDSEKKRARFDPITDPVFPEPLDTGAFRTAWTDWNEYRVERKLSRYVERGAKSQLTILSKIGHDRAIESINLSIANQWQGIHEPSQSNQSAQSDQTSETPEQKKTRVCAEIRALEKRNPQGADTTGRTVEERYDELLKQQEASQ